MLKQNLQQKLLQKLSPQQLQFIKLLQIPTTLLDARIKEELEINPALEDKSLSNNNSDEDIYNIDNNEDGNTQEEGNLDDTNLSIEDLTSLNDDSYNTYNTAGNDDSASETKSIPITVKNSFYENLINQLKLINLNETQFTIAKQLIGSLDDDGYLHRQLSSISDDILFAKNLSVSEKQLEEVLKLIQSLDPPGIAARSLQECLLIQLHKKSTKSDAIKIAIDIIKNHLLEFTRKHYDKLTKILNISIEQLKLAINEILKLNPKPGGTDISSGGASQIHITPDFIVFNNDGELTLTLNARNAPELHINKGYKNMLSTYSEQAIKDKKLKETVQFVKQKIESAKWFIDAIKQRQQTLLKVMNAIMNFQYEYFIDGDEKKLKPMILKDIADKIDMDISTVSRVANSKYVQTNFGTYVLKDFFSEAIQTNDGEEVSNKEVKKILKECIENEGKQKPLSDSKLAQILKDKGYNIARRTVAKYREQLNIPVARLRKEII